MVSIFLRRTFAFGGVLLLVLAMFGQPAFAAKWGGTPSDQDLEITSVLVDLDANILTIGGKNFLNGDPPVVTLDGTELTVIGDPTDSEIVVELPEGTVGDLLVTATTGNSAHQFDKYNLTLVAPGGTDLPPINVPLLELEFYPF